MCQRRSVQPALCCLLYTSTVVLHAKEGTDTYRISFKSICFDDDGRTVEAIGLAEQLDERLNESEDVYKRQGHTGA